MVTVNGVEFGTKEEAAARCKAFAAANPGTKFHNHAHCKEVRRETTEAEREAARASDRCVLHTTTLYEWEKLYTDALILAAHPELRGLWYEKRNAQKEAQA